MLASTTTTILGFMPIFLLLGNVGDFVGPIAISVVLALAASFVISMTVIAALAARFAPPAAKGPDRPWWRDGLASRRLATVYRKALTWSLKHPSSAIALSLILPALGFLLASTLGNQFFPPADRAQFEPEILHTQATVLRGEPKLSFQADEDEARLTGLTLSGIAGQFDGNLEGQQGGSVLEDLEQLPVRIRYGVQERQSLDHIAALNLASGTAVASDAWIPAEALGDMVLQPELSTITRRDGERVNTVLAYVTQGTLPVEVTREVLSRLEEEDFVLAPGYHLEVAGDREEQGRAIGQLLTYVPVLVMLMVTTLVLIFPQCGACRDHRCRWGTLHRAWYAVALDQWIPAGV